MGKRAVAFSLEVRQLPAHVDASSPGSSTGAHSPLTFVVPAGASLHVCMTPHGPDAAVTAKAMASDTSKPARLPDDSLAFMFEVRDIPRVMTQALQSELLEKDYWKCWQGFKTAAASAPAAPRAEANGKTCQPSVL